MKKSRKPVRGKNKIVLRRSRFGAISSVEGIKIPKGTEREFTEFDTARLSGDERRAIIRDKYRKS